MVERVIHSGVSLKGNYNCYHTTTSLEEFKKLEHDSRYLGGEEKGGGTEEGDENNKDKCSNYQSWENPETR